MNIAEFKAELVRLIKKGLTAGLAMDAMADALTEAAEDLPDQEIDCHPLHAARRENEIRSEKAAVGDVKASHRS